MQNSSQSRPTPYAATPLVDFRKLQERYQSVKLAERARLVLMDADPALKIAEDILMKLASSNPVKLMFGKMRKNAMLAGKMRPSGARDLMIDSSSDFVAGTIRKLAAWRKTMERLGSGEDVITVGSHEAIAPNSKLALAIAGNACVSNYLSIIQLALNELVHTDKKNATSYRAVLSDLRRSATVISDCENASGITELAV